jgi:hypothetical protein
MARKPVALEAQEQVETAEHLILRGQPRLEEGRDRCALLAHMRGVICVLRQIRKTRILNIATREGGQLPTIKFLVEHLGNRKDEECVLELINGLRRGGTHSA